ncbi:MAG TPA: hypothetical protein VH539_05190 [Gemmatimonadaceae bacterium]|jgi:hypothetical protein
MPSSSSTPDTRGPGALTYLKHAFLYHWNLLLFLGGAGLAALSPWPDALLPILGALELAYLTSLIAMPRFRTAIDAKVAGKMRQRETDPASQLAAQQSLQRIIDQLPPASLRRFIALRERCFEMRDIASGVRGQTTDVSDSADAIRTPALDRLLFLFLKLLTSQNGLDRFLKSTSEGALSQRAQEVRARLTAAQAVDAAKQDERTIRSLQDSVADAELRLDNYHKSMKDAEFVSIELDRIETKIQALTEMAVSRQDPDALSHQVTAAAESMQQTEQTVNQLQHLTGLADQLEEPPSILNSSLGKAVLRAR